MHLTHGRSPISTFVRRVGAATGRVWGRGALLALLLIGYLPSGIAAPLLGPALAGYTLVSRTATTNPAVFQYVVRVDLQNQGTVARNVTATFSAATTATTLTQATAHFGDVWPGETTASTDTLTVLQGASFDPTQVVLGTYTQGATATTTPRADAGTAQVVFAGQTVVLDGARSYHPAGKALTYAWTLVSAPVGSKAVLASASSVRPSFTADIAGVYAFSLTVSDGTLTSAPATVSVFTDPASVPPIASAGPDQVTSVGGLVALDGTGSTDLNGSALTYSWTFLSRPAGSAAVIAKPGSAQTSFVADVAGSYVVGLKVSDAKSTSTQSALVVTAGSSPSIPRVIVGVDQSVALKKAAILDGTASRDAAGAALTYHWTLLARPAGSTAALVNPTTYYPILTPDVPGVYVAQLIVNNGLADSHPVEVVVTTVPATIDAALPYAVPGPDQTAAVGTVVTLNGGASTDPNGAPLSYQWSLLSAPATSRAAVTPTNTPTADFTPDANGLYVGQLAVSNGVSTGPPQTVRVSAVPPPVKAVNDVAFTKPTTAVTIPVLLNDSGGSGPLSVSSVWLPLHGLTLISGGAVTYTPFPGFTGTDQFAYTATDGVSASVATVTVTVSAALTAQTLSFGAAPTVTVGNAGAITATASSGLPVILSSLTPSTCALAGTTVTGLNTGACVIAANQPGNATFATAPQVTQTFTVGPGKTVQSISFGPAPAVALGGTGSLAATASSGLPVTFASTTPTLCTVSGTTVTALAGGVCVVSASQAGNATFAPAPNVTEYVTITLKSQAITFTAVPPTTVGNTAALSATSSSGLTVAFSATTPTICTVSGTVLSAVSNGTCVVTASQPGSASFLPAPNVVQNVGVILRTQSITFGTAPSLSLGGTATVSATATSGLALTFTSTTPTVCTVSGAVVTSVIVGNCVVAANQAGNATYGPAPQATQTISVNAPTARTIETFAGRGATTTPVTAAAANIQPWPIALGLAGSVYFADKNAVYRYDPPTSTISAVAGNHTAGYSGDGGPATSAQIGGPAGNGVSGLVVDSAGNLYIADEWNAVVRKVTPAGVISTFAGTGAYGYTGDGGPATSATFYCPYKLHLDASNGLLISDCQQAVRRVDLATNLISTVPGTAAMINVTGVTSDAAGNVYVLQSPTFGSPAGTALDTLSKVTPSGVASTLVTLNRCSNGLAIDSVGNLYTTDCLLNVILKIPTTGLPTAIAGTGATGSSPDGTLASVATLAQPYDVTVDANGNVYFTDFSDFKVRTFAPGGTLVTLAGANDNIGGLATGADEINNFVALAVDPAGNLYSGPYIKVDPNGTLTRVARTPGNGFSGDGGNVSAATFASQGIAFDSAGNAYVADTGNNRVRKISASGTVTTIAGNGTLSNSGDGGPASAAAVSAPVGTAVDGAGNVYVIALNPVQTGLSDCGTTVRKIDKTGTISLYAGSYTSTILYGGDGGPATAAQIHACGIAADAAGNVYLAEAQNQRVRKIGTTGIITTLAGTGVRGYNGDGGPANAAQLNGPRSVAVDSAGNVHVVEESGQRIRVISSTGIIATEAGTGVAGYSGDGGDPAKAAINGAIWIAVDSQNQVYFADTGNNVIRRIKVRGTSPQSVSLSALPALSIGGTATLTTSATSGLAVTVGSLTNAVCTVSGTTVTAVGAGTCTVAANQTGNSTFASAAQVTQSVVVSRRTQSITFGAAPAVAVGGTGTVTATATSGLAVVFSSTTPTICSVTGATVTGLTTGVCVVSANQAGNSTFAPAPQVTQSITVATGTKTAQTITFGTAPAVSVGTSGTLSATATSTLAVTFSSTTPAICSVTGSTVTGVTIGSCVVAANQAGNATFAPAPQVTQTINVSGKTQTITFGTAPSVTVGSSGSLSATATSGLAVTFSSTTPTFCTVSGTTVTGVATGNCIVAANQVGNTTFAPAPQVTQSITVATGTKTAQTITFGTAPAVSVGTSGTLSATATSTLAVTFSSTTPAICSVSGSTVTGVTIGSCVVAANQAGNATFAPAPQVTQTINVSGKTQTITFGTAPSVTVGTSGALSATATSGLPVTFSSTTPTFCTVAGSTVTGVAAGSCVVAANQAGNTTYAPAPQVTLTITVGTGVTPQSQTITFGPAPTVTVGTSAPLSATASSGLPVSFSTSSTAFCTVSGAIVTGVAAGPCVVTANQAGNASFLAAPSVSQTITVGTPSAVGSIQTWAGRASYLTAVPAASANVVPWPLAVSSTGVVYFGERNAVERFDPAANTVIAVAGNGTNGFSGDGGTATSAQLGIVSGLALDTAGNLYIADPANERVRKVTPAGIISTFAGTGTAGSTGDGGLASAAQLNCPYYLHVDASNNLLIAECGNGVRKINLSTGIISSVAGTAGKFPQSVTSDAAGNVYFLPNNGQQDVASAPLDVLYKVTPAGVVTSLATLNHCSEGLAIDAGGNLYTTDTCLNNVYQISAAGVVTVIAGTTAGGFSPDGTPAATATLAVPADVALDAAGTVYFTDLANFRVRKFTPGGTLHTVAGTDNGYGGLASASYFGGFYAGHLGTNAAGTVFGGVGLAEIATTQIITQYVGTPHGYSGDGGPVGSAAFRSKDLKFDSAGNGYVADFGNDRVRKITAAGIVSTIAGNGTFSNTGDGGAAASATIGGPSSVAPDAAGNLYVVVDGTAKPDCGNAIRKIAANGTISLFAGSYTSAGSTGDGGAATAALLNSVCGIATDAAGNLYIADTFNNRVRKVTAATGVITTVAGTGTAGYSGDGGAATAAQLNQPYDVGIDSTGNLHIADAANNRIRVVSTAGIITTEAGTGVAGLTGDGGAATAAQLNNPQAIALDSSGTLYVNDFGNNRIRRLRIRGSTTQVITFGTAPTLQVGGTATVTATASSGLPVTLTSTTAAICTVSGTIVTGLASGSCVVAANQDGNGSYAAAAQVTQNVTVSLKPQTITFGAAPAVSVGGTGTVSATAGSGLAVVFSSTTPATCSVAGSVVSGLATGSCIIAGNQPGNATYAAAPQVTQTLTVTAGKSAQTITFGTAPTLTVGGTGTLSATASSGLAVTFSSTTPSTCAVSGSTVVGLNTGACIVAADQAGSTSFAPAAQVTQTITVAAGLLPQSVAILGPFSARAGTTATLNVLATSGLPVTVTSQTPAICTVSGSTLTALVAGNCIVIASQAGNSTYAPAPQFPQTLPVTVSGLLYPFGRTALDGTNPQGSLVQATDGNFYGTTSTGGPNNNAGTLFKVTPAGIETTVYAFGASATDASSPVGPLLQATDGNFYGVANGGGTYGQGAVFKVTPAGVETVLYSFGGKAYDGVLPFGGLIQASDGNLYGTTACGGSGALVLTAGDCGPNTRGGGTVFKLTLAGVETVLYSFGTAATDAVFPGALIQGADGNLYGAAYYDTTATGCGQVFKVTTAGVETLLAGFTGAADGCVPEGLVQATDGNLYVTTRLGGGGAYDKRGGAFWKITLTGTKTLVYAFGATVTDGTRPLSNPIQGSDGNFYGTTYHGGTYINGCTDGYAGCGTVYRITPAGVETQVYNFGGPPFDAARPGAYGRGVIQATDGNFYGTSVWGGPTGLVSGLPTAGLNPVGGGGAVFKVVNAVTPPTVQSITFGASPTIAVGATGTVTATATSGLAVTFSSLTPTICTVSGSTVTGISGGACGIIANQNGNATYAPAPPVTHAVCIGAANIYDLFCGFSTGSNVAGSLWSYGNVPVPGGPLVPFAQPLTLTGNLATLSGWTNATTNSAVLNNVSDSHYVGGSASVNLDAQPGAVLLVPSAAAGGAGLATASFTAPAPGTYAIAAAFQGANFAFFTANGNPVTIGVHGKAPVFQAPVVGDGPLSVQSYSGTVALAAGDQIEFAVGPAGTGTVAQFGEGAVDLRATVTLVSNAARSTQTITLGAPPVFAVGTTGVLSGTASSGLPVVFTSLTPTTCIAAATSVVGIATGVCTIAANQPGNATYLSAPQVTLSVSLGTAQTITFGAAPTLVVGGSGTIAATASSGLPVAFSSLTPDLCAVSGTTIKGLATGSCVVAANQAGNTTYTPAPQVTQTITL